MWWYHLTGALEHSAKSIVGMNVALETTFIVAFATSKLGLIAANELTKNPPELRASW